VSFRALLTQTVEVQHHSLGAGAVDDYGNQVDTFAPGVEYAARLEQRIGLEQTGDQNIQVGEWLLILPPEAVIDGTDRVLADGATFEVVGPPVRQRTPRGVHHIEAALRLVES
jgi:hypothetical protein